ncbi:TPA: DUF2000 domain-containing protein [Yersinia enterocolitica]
MNNNKCVIIIDSSLSQGLIANTAAVLTLSLGKLHPELIGEDNFNGDGGKHKGITTIPIPILITHGEHIRELRSLLNDETTVVDFSNIAQLTKSYQDYSNRLAITKATEISYLGIIVYGNKKIISRYTGNLGLLR